MYAHIVEKYDCSDKTSPCPPEATTLWQSKAGCEGGGAKQSVHWFLGGKGLDIQQGTSVKVGLPKSYESMKGSLGLVKGNLMYYYYIYICVEL